jgi:hypothetical protein
LKAYVISEEYEDQPRDKWAVAISVTVKALQDFREAEIKRQTQLIDEANSIAEKAMASLKSMYGIPAFIFIFSENISNHLSFNAVWTQFQALTLLTN